MNTPTQTQGGESATPRTDAEAAKHRVYDCAVNRHIEMQIVPADFARQLERETATLHAQLGEAQKKQPINTHRRLFDLVRNCRAKLHEEDLITDDEYAWLCQHEFPEDKGKSGSPSPRRLEDYDDMHAQIARMKTREGELVGALELLLNQADANADFCQTYTPQSRDAARAALQSVAKEGDTK